MALHIVLKTYLVVVARADAEKYRSYRGKIRKIETLVGFGCLNELTICKQAQVRSPYHHMTS